jgi:phospholipid transport system substrate-binding protein
MLWLYRRLYLLLFFIVLVNQSTAQPAAQNNEVYKNFITTLGNNIISILVNKNAPLPERKQQFRQVLRDYFDVAEIGKFVLARYWKKTTDQQKEEYLELFENAIVDNYAAQFDSYQNEKLEVQNVREGSDQGIMVMSVIKRQTGAPPLKVDWKIFQTKKGLRVYDIIVNGVSMSITQRSEYGGIISQNRGQIEGLLKLMREGKSPIFSVEK